MRFTVKRIIPLADRESTNFERDRYKFAPVPASMAFVKHNSHVRGQGPIASQAEEKPLRIS